MGLCKTSNFSIFISSCAGDLKFCTRSYSKCLSHDEVLRFAWKRLQSDEVTLWYSIQVNYSSHVFCGVFCEFLVLLF